MPNPVPSDRRTAAWAIVMATLAGFALAGCDEKLSSVAGPTPNLQPTFASIQANIFQAPDTAGRSACLACHTPSGIAAAVLDLRPEVAYANLVNVRSRFQPGAVLVVPGDPDSSYLIQKLEGRPGITGLRMPRNGPPYLTDGQIFVIRRWIQTGANNN